MLIRQRMDFFVNYKNETSISENHYLWYDAIHLNYQGSIAMTTLYNQFLHSIEKQIVG